MQNTMPGLEQGAGSQVLNYLQLTWYRRRFVLLVTLVVTLFAVAWFSLQPPVYRSTSSLRIGLQESQDAASGDFQSAAAAVDEIDGEVEVLQSRTLAAALVRQLQLQLYPELNPEETVDAGFPASLWRNFRLWVAGLGQPERAAPEQGTDDDPLLSGVVDRLLARLDVERVGHSRVVRITFTSHDPQLSARVANALPEAYMAARQQARIQASSSAADFAAEQFLELQERLAASERAEAYYRQTLDLREVEQIDQLKAAIAERESQLLIAKSRRDDALARLDLIEALSGSAELSPQALDGLGSPEIARLLERRAQLNAQVEGQPGSAAGTGRAIQDIAAANAAIRLELNRLVGALQEEAATASEDVVALEAGLAGIKLESSTQHRRLLQLRELEKETAINRMRYDAAVERMRQSGIGAELVTADTELISAAAVSQEPLYPDRGRNILLWAVAGLVLGLLLVLFRQLRNPGLLSPEHVHFVLGESTIGVIPRVRGAHAQAPHDLVLDSPKSDFSAAVAALKITLDLSDMDEPTRAVQLVSSTPGEGRASLAVALARYVAGEGHEVLLVSAHLRHSSIEEKMGVSTHAPGLTDLMLSDDPDLDDYLQRDHRSSVHVLSAGTAEYANPDVVFSSQRMHTLVQQLRDRFGFIVFDTPPVMSAAEAISIGRLVDKTLFVVRWNKTPKALVASSLEQLRSGGLDLAGVVLQHVNLQRYGNIEFSDFGYLYHQKR